MKEVHPSVNSWRPEVFLLAAENDMPMPLKIFFVAIGIALVIGWLTVKEPVDDEGDEGQQ